MKVYCAGPDVFCDEPVARGEYLKALCADAGLQALYPLDNQAPAHLAGPELAEWIFSQNLKLIYDADAILVNLACFRGHEPDSGTVFEMGLAFALQKPIWAYYPECGSMRDMVPTDAQGRCAEGMHVEDFGLPRNLMLACSSRLIHESSQSDSFSAA